MNNNNSDSKKVVPSKGELGEKKKNKVHVKKRNWAFILYPESAPEDWKETLQKTGLPVAVSPIHDKDKNPTGEPKKAHYHVILAYAGPTSYNVVLRLTESLNASIPQPLEQVRGYYRYLTHKDNPEKAQYLEKDIVTINGFDCVDFLDLKKSEVIKIKKDLILMISEHGFVEYSQFIDYLMCEGSDSQFDVGCGNTYFFDKYISSKRHSSPKL